MGKKKVLVSYGVDIDAVGMHTVISLSFVIYSDLTQLAGSAHTAAKTQQATSAEVSGQEQ